MQSPVDYYFRYHAITVPSSDGSDDLATDIRVDHYRLGAQEKYMDERARLGRKVKKDLQIRRKEDPDAVIRVRVSTPNGIEEQEFSDLAFQNDDQLWALLRHPYVGKGSPEAVQVALQLGAVELEGSPAIVKPENFQSYCDTWFGLDCNGLVGNYLRHEYEGIAWPDVTADRDANAPDNLITDIFNRFDGTVRNAADEIDFNEFNVLAMVDSQGKIIAGGAGGFGHIMMSGPGERDDISDLKSKLGVAADATVPAICVVESTAAVDGTDGQSGLARSWYACVDHPTQKGVIRVHRGLNGSVINVRIKGAPWSG